MIQAIGSLNQPEIFVLKDQYSRRGDLFIIWTKDAEWFLMGLEYRGKGKIARYIIGPYLDHPITLIYLIYRPAHFKKVAPNLKVVDMVAQVILANRLIVERVKD
jgi:hypothetical protein